MTPMALYRTLLLDFVLISRTVRKHQKFGCCSTIAARIFLFHTYAMLLVLDSLSTTQTWIFQTFMSNIGQADKFSILHFNFHFALFETFSWSRLCHWWLTELSAKLLCLKYYTYFQRGNDHRELSWGEMPRRKYLRNVQETQLKYYTSWQVGRLPFTSALEVWILLNYVEVTTIFFKCNT